MTQFLRKIPIVGTDLWELVRRPGKGVSLVAAHGNLGLITLGLLSFWGVMLFASRDTFLQGWRLGLAREDSTLATRTVILVGVFAVLHILTLYPALWLLPTILWHVLLRMMGRRGSFKSLLTISGHAFLVPIIATLPLAVLRMIQDFTILFLDPLLTMAILIWIASICALSIRQLYGVSKVKAITVTIVGALLTPVIYGLLGVILLLFLASLGAILRLAGVPQCAAR